MNAGLPGTGLGGLFYIASALAMPFHRARRGAGHDGRSWRRVVAQASIALGILFALWGTGLALGWLLTDPAQSLAGSPTGSVGAGSVVRWILVVGTLGLLVTLLSVVEVASAVLRMRRRSAVPRLDTVPLRASRRRRGVLRRPWGTRHPSAPASSPAQESSDMALPESA